MASDGWVLAVDGGATKTELLLVDGKHLRGLSLTGRGTNPNVYGKSGVERLGSLIETLLNRGNCAAETVCGTVVGMAGIGNPRYRGLIERDLKSRLPETALKLTSDAELAHRSIWKFAPGITLVAGTGSVALATNRRGDFRRVGGFGYQVGDEGSGYWLGKSILTALITSEGSSAQDVRDLLDRILRRCGCSVLEEALDHFSSGEEGVSRVADLAPLVLSCAEQNNLLASQIVARGAEALAALVLDIVRKMDDPSDPPAIGFHGSVMIQSSFYRKLVEDQLLFHFDRIEWVNPRFPAVFGGLVLAGEPIGDFSAVEITRV